MKIVHVFLIFWESIYNSHSYSFTIFMREAIFQEMLSGNFTKCKNYKKVIPRVTPNNHCNPKHKNVLFARSNPIIDSKERF